MDYKHRFDTETRRHYSFEKHYSLRLNPHLLYAGTLDKTTDWSEQPHKHRFCEIMLVTDGEGQVSIDSKLYDVKRGDIVVYDPQKEHFEKSSNFAPMELLFFAADLFKINTLPEAQLLPQDFSPVISSGESFESLNTLFCGILSECKTKNAFFGEVAASLAKAAMLLILRIANGKETELSKTNKVAAAALDYLERNYLLNISLDELARLCFVDKYYLSHVFTKAVGMSVGNYVKQLRIDKAKLLLSTANLSVSDVAVAVGYSDPSYFSRIFKQKTGLTPLQYRKVNGLTQYS